MGLNETWPKIKGGLKAVAVEFASLSDKYATQVNIEFLSYTRVIVGHGLCWKDHLDFHCQALYQENAMTDFHDIWYVGSTRHKCYPCGLSSPNTRSEYLISFHFL